MQLEEIFYSIFWISAISTIWFYTDWVDYYMQLFGICKDFRLRYRSFVMSNTDKYFPDYLYKLSLTTENRFLKFFLKLISCPFCLLVWLAVICGVVYNSFLIVGPVYVLSLLIHLQIRKML